MHSEQRLTYRVLWLSLGWLLVAGVGYLSLTPKLFGLANTLGVAAAWLMMRGRRRHCLFRLEHVLAGV